MVIAASATIGFGVAPGGTDRPDRAMALGATPMEVEPSATDEPTAAERFASRRITAAATATVEPSSTPAPTATATIRSQGGVAAAALISTSGESYSSGTVKAWARQAGWPESTLDAVVAVAWCESSHRPGVTNGIAYGLMQVVPLWFSYAGVPFSQWTDPVANLRVAYAAYNYDLNRGYAPWTQWQCKPYMVAAPPAEETGVEDGVDPLPTAEPTATATPTGTTPPASPTAPPPSTETPVSPTEAPATATADPAETEAPTLEPDATATN